MEMSHDEFRKAAYPAIKECAKTNLSDSELYLFDGFVNNFRAVFSRSDSIVWRIAVEDLVAVARECFVGKIQVDGRSCYLFPRYSIVRGTYKKAVISVEIKDNINVAVGEFCEKANANCFVSVFSKSQFEYLSMNNLRIPDCVADLPLSAETRFVTSIFDASGVLIRVVSRGGGMPIIAREFFTTEQLLSTARRVIKDGKVFVEGGGLAVGPWQGGSDSLEMLKKTALRQYIVKRAKVRNFNINS